MKNEPLKTIAHAAPIAPKNGAYAGYFSGSDITIFQQNGTKLWIASPSFNFKTVRNSAPMARTHKKLSNEAGPSDNHTKSGL